MTKKKYLFVLVFFTFLLIAAAFVFLDLKKNNFAWNDFITKKEMAAEDVSGEKPFGGESFGYMRRGTREETAVVARVIDGDTFVLESGERVRIIGIDTDEGGEPCFSEARERLLSLVGDRSVRLVREAKNKNFDKYGRLLRRVFAGDEDVGTILVGEGLAEARFLNGSDEYIKEIIEAESRARKYGIGCEWNQNEKKDFAGTIAPCSAFARVGEKVEVLGKIVEGMTVGRGTVFLNFGAPFPKQCLTLVIFGAYGNLFPKHAEAFYKNKLVRATGEITEYQGRPQIILEDAGQIGVVEF